MCPDTRYYMLKPLCINCAVYYASRLWIPTSGWEVYTYSNEM